MKQLGILAVFAAFLLGACGGSDQPSAPATAPQPSAEQQPLAETPDATPAEETEPAEDMPQMVEESAAEEEEEADTDQPILLAESAAPPAPRQWKFSEGKHFERLVPTQPLWGGADKIEVVEIFWYGCNHCYNFEQFINQWAESIPANVRFVRIPVTWSPAHRLHAQLFFTEQVLVENGKIADPEGFRAAVFAEYHRRGNRLLSLDAIQQVFETHGVSEADFNSAWSSFPVSQRLNKAADLTRPERYNITGVPAVVVNGKYKAMNTEGYPRLLELIDELILRESTRSAN